MLSWNVFGGFQTIAFLIYLLAAYAETNRAPFDLPEAESELVAGYHTEYSSMKFAMFFMAEYANMITVSCVATLLFFGGASSPFGHLFDGYLNFGHTPSSTPSCRSSGSSTKILFFLLLYIWVRATVPRFRYDQLMGFGWKFLLPVAMVNILATSLALRCIPDLGALAATACFTIIEKPRPFHPAGKIERSPCNWHSSSSSASSPRQERINLLLQRHPINSALSLVVVMMSLAVLYWSLGAEFLAAAQVIVYSGAIMVLFVFVIMLLNAGEEERTTGSKAAYIAGFPGAACHLLPAQLCLPVGAHAALASPILGGHLNAAVSNISEISTVLFRDLLLPFEVTSILILVAILGAVVLARKEQ